MAGQQKSLRQPHAERVLRARKARHLRQPGAHTKCNWDSVGGRKKKGKKTQTNSFKDTSRVHETTPIIRAKVCFQKSRTAQAKPC